MTPGQNPLNREPSLLGYPKREVLANPIVTREDAGKMNASSLNPLGEACDGSLKGVGMPSHGSSVVCYTTLSTQNNIAMSRHPYDPWAMSNWPQRDNFKKLVLDHRKEHGLTPEAMADLLGLKPSGLHGLLYDKRTGCPKLETAQQAARVLGVKLSEIVDDPGKEIAGNDASGLSEARRFLANAMFHGITADEISDEDAQLLYEDFLASRARISSLKARLKK